MMDWIQENFWLYMLLMLGGCACGLAILFGLIFLLVYLIRRGKSGDSEPR